MFRKSTEPPLSTGLFADDLEMTDLLLRAGARASAANRDGATPMQLASLNGSAAMIGRLLKAGVDANAPLSSFGDTALMLAARTGKPEAVKLLLDSGAKVDARESWGDTTALMWAVAEGNHAVVRLLIDRGADVNLRSKFVPSATGRGFEGATPVAAKANQPAEDNASGSLTPLMFAAREGDWNPRACWWPRAQTSMFEVGTARTPWAWRSSTAATMCILPDRQSRQRESGRRPALYSVVLGGRPSQHGDGSEFSLDGDCRPAASDRKASRRRCRCELSREQYSSRPHERRFSTNCLRNRFDARCILGDITW